MVTKMFKIALIVVVIGALVGGLLFGADLVSYLKSSAKSVQTAVKDSVPMEFELQRAQDMLEEVIPEMHANIRLIAQEEVQIANLKQDITESETRLTRQHQLVANLRQKAGTQHAQVQTADYKPDGATEQLTEELAQRFEHFKEAQLVLAGKKRLLDAREKSLVSAMQMLERTRSRKALLEEKIQGLDSQYRLVQAASINSGVHFDNSKLAQTEKLLSHIKNRLDVAERVLAHESQFIEDQKPFESAVDRTALLAEIDEYLQPPTPAVDIQPATKTLADNGLTNDTQQ